MAAPPGPHPIRAAVYGVAVPTTGRRVSDTFTRRHLLGLGAGAAAAAAATAVVGRDLRGESAETTPTGADRLAAWTPASPAFLPSDREAPYVVRAADLSVLARVERSIDGRVRSIPHRWLDAVEGLVGVDRDALGGHLRLAGRGLVQVLDWQHDLAAVERRLESADYERVDDRSGFAVYRQPRSLDGRELRTVPHLDDAVATDGSRLLTCGSPQLADPVPTLLAAIDARAGEARLVDRPGFEAGLLGSAPSADLLTVVPTLRPWLDESSSELAGLRGYHRAVSFEGDRALVRSALLYERGTVPDAPRLRALFRGNTPGPEVGVSPASDLRVTRHAAGATVWARAPLTAVAQ